MKVEKITKVYKNRTKTPNNAEVEQKCQSFVKI